MSAVLEVDADNFEQEVLERSRSVPVVVDFWAAWCGPCRQLGPVLEKLAEEYADSLVLVKIDTDNNQELSASFGIRGIPAVKLFRDGRVVDEFVGALPEPQVRSFLAPHLPSPAADDFDRGARLEEAGDQQAAIAAYRQTLERDGGHAGALLALGRLLQQAGSLVEARDLLRRVPAQSPELATADSLLAAMDLEAEAAGYEQEACRRKLEGDDSDLEARLGLALHSAVAGRYKRALEQLLELVALDKSYRDGAARKAMLKVFEIVGPRSELAEHFRSKLANLLY